MTVSEKQPAGIPAWLQPATRIISICAIAALVWLAFSTPDINNQGITIRPVEPCIMDQKGYLRGKVFGRIEGELNWDGNNMRCDGMYRPEGAGIRLVFDEHLDEDVPGLLMVIGISDAVPGAVLKDAPANVTVIDQSRGLFFSTQEEPRCWTSFTNQLQLTGTVQETWRIEGVLYCASALPALKGGGTITLGDISYSGVFKPAVN